MPLFAEPPMYADLVLGFHLVGAKRECRIRSTNGPDTATNLVTMNPKDSARNACMQRIAERCQTSG
jgi:hypothetical protein